MTAGRADREGHDPGGRGSFPPKPVLSTVAGGKAGDGDDGRPCGPVWRFTPTLALPRRGGGKSRAFQPSGSPRICPSRKERTPSPSKGEGRDGGVGRPSGPIGVSPPPWPSPVEGEGKSWAFQPSGSPRICPSRKDRTPSPSKGEGWDGGVGRHSVVIGISPLPSFDQAQDRRRGRGKTAGRQIATWSSLPPETPRRVARQRIKLIGGPRVASQTWREL
jgi:hypothetical protein